MPHPPPDPASAKGHYFDDSPAVGSRPSSVLLHLPDLRLDLAVDRGVFSIERVDPGTRYLLLDGPALPENAVPRTYLDLGCGYGPIACTLALRSPAATVWAVDVNERARALTTANAAAAGVSDRVHVAAPDLVPDDVRFDAIWSNPPIRIGKAQLHDLLTRWLSRLTPEGHAVLVVQKHLGADSLAAWLNTCGYSVDRLGSRMGYRLLEVRPHPTPEDA